MPLHDRDGWIDLPGRKLYAPVSIDCDSKTLVLMPFGVRYLYVVRRSFLACPDFRRPQANTSNSIGSTLNVERSQSLPTVIASSQGKSKLKGRIMNADLSPAESPANFQPVVPTVAEVAVPLNNDSNSEARVEKEFDAYAAQYESALNEGLSVSGEGPEYFAQERVQWVAKLLHKRQDVTVRSILDFGCGVGIATPLLQSAWQPESILGFDPSSAAIVRANKEFSGDSTSFTFSSTDIPHGSFDLAYCNGVFHHILPEDRQAALSTVFKSLKPGGWFAFWENNPWNPGTRYVMSKIPFDRDAIVISPPEARQLLKQVGFQIVRSDAWFLFPRSLSWLRPLERLVHRLPLGAQYLVLAQKPNA